MFKKAVQRGRSERAPSHGVAGMIPTAPIERAHSERARSGSTGIVTVALCSFFNILLMDGERNRRKGEDKDGQRAPAIHVTCGGGDGHQAGDHAVDAS